MSSDRKNCIAVSILALLLFLPGKISAETVYVANEGTATISVIDTTTDTILHTICLGSDPAIPGTPQPTGPCNGETQHHNPFYNGHVGTHGLWLTPDGSVLLVANRISGTIVAIDTAAVNPPETHGVLGYASVGREPHLATVRPGGFEAYVAVRGESHVDILELDPTKLFDPTRRRTDRMRTTATVDTMLGPSMVSFTSNGQFAFVASGKENRVDKIHAVTKKIVASQTVTPLFTPFGLVTPDDQELYLVHKGAGTLSILRTSNLSFLVQDLSIGPRANHVYFVGNLAYVTIGGPAPSETDPDPEGKIVIIDRMSREIVNELTGPEFTGDPHGIWATSDGTKLYVGHERGNRITVINTGDPNNPFDDTVVAVINELQDDPFLKQPIDVVIKP
jgi:YVTN family beta-propeller protein